MAAHASRACGELSTFQLKTSPFFVLAVLHASTACSSGKVVGSTVFMLSSQPSFRLASFGSARTPYSAAINGLGRAAAQAYHLPKTALKSFHLVPGFTGAKLY